MIKIYSGKTVCPPHNNELHPVAQVERAKKFYDETYKSDETYRLYSNSPDFVSAMFHIGQKLGVEVSLYLDGVKTDLDSVFGDFNKAYDLLNEYAGLSEDDEDDDFGWDCKLSPDKKCHYYSGIDENHFNKRYVLLKDGTKHYEDALNKFTETEENESDDCCLFCGQPEERK